MHNTASVGEGRLRVLVVDDDAHVMRATARLLAGFDVTTAHGALKALAVLEACPDFDVVVCDVAMPRLTGPELYQAVLKVNPALRRRFVFVSGSLEMAVKHLIRHIGSDELQALPLLEKPFTSTEIVAAVRRLAARTEPRSGVHETASAWTSQGQTADLASGGAGS